MARNIKIVEGVDYYVESGGRLVFTEEYHLKRGYCCNGRCRHCPWKETKTQQSGSLIRVVLPQKEQ